ncbi:MAG: hypothetical protein NT162_00445 [Candidatus Woesebacteria bacterium]|nr:hypothetical protein [Candidatus Woesebacteria bacterium]
MGRIISEVNKAYIAGLIDADGAIMASIEKHNEKKFGFRVRVIIKITQSNPKILFWIQKVFLTGRIVKNRTTYDWLVKDQKDVSKTINIIKKYLKVKNKQAKIALKILNLKIISKNSLINIAKLADTLASFNVRSKNRRKNFAIKIEENIPPND